MKNYSNLIELHLDGNWLTDLPGKLFEVMSKLEVLNLSHNNISKVEPKALAGLVNLRELDLSYNRLQSLPPHLLDDLKKLSILKLRGNTLRDLDVTVERNPLTKSQIPPVPALRTCPVKGYWTTVPAALRGRHRQQHFQHLQLSQPLS
uniref:Uncharacterized protein n=1 Tax=Salmo trutta TaxID=8032 RepID=A0A673Z4S6_SALTR